MFVQIRLREFEGNSKLEMDECRPEDAGTIACTATNSEGQATTSAQFAVQQKQKGAEFVRKPESTVQVERGEQALFEVQASGTPAPEFTW